MKEVINNTGVKEFLPYDEMYEDKFFYKKLDTIEKAQDFLDHISNEYAILRDNYRQCKQAYTEHPDLQEYEALQKKARRMNDEIQELNSIFNRKDKAIVENDLSKLLEEIEILKKDPQVEQALLEVEKPMLEADEIISRAGVKKDIPFMVTNQIVIPYLHKKFQLHQELTELEASDKQHMEAEIERLYKELADCENQIDVSEKEYQLEQEIGRKEYELRNLPNRIARIKQSIDNLESALDKNVVKFRASFN